MLCKKWQSALSATVLLASLFTCVSAQAAPSDAVVFSNSFKPFTENVRVLGIADPPASTPTTIVVRQTFYVAPNGNDSNPGTEALPWATIDKAAQTLNAGETVLVKDGTYGGVYVNRSGKPGQPISFRAFPGAKPRIEIKVIDRSGFFIQGASYINIDGFDLDYTYPITDEEKKSGERTEGGIVIFGATTEEPAPAHHIIVTNNRIHGFPGGGVGSNLADYITVKGNTIWETAFWSKFGNSAISLYQNVNADPNPGFHNVIRANTVFNNENKVPSTGTENTVITDGNCIIIDDGRLEQTFLVDKTKFTKYTKYTGSTLIENNICADNGGRGVNVFSSDNVLVRHNTLYKNSRTPNLKGELSALAASNVRFVNNIIYARSDKPATDVYDGTDTKFKVSDIVFENNLYFGTNDIPNKTSSDRVANPFGVNP